MSDDRNEVHEQQFRGTWAFPTLHRLVETGKLSPVAAWLAMVIDSLSHTDRKCFASNAYLGKKIHKSESRVRALLADLEDTGILISKWVGDERRLWIDHNGTSVTKRSENYKKELRPIENSRSRPIENNRLKTIGEYIKNIDNKEGESASPPSPPPTHINGNSLNGTVLKENASTSTIPKKDLQYQPRKKKYTKFQPFVYKWAKDLREILTKVANPNRMVSGNENAWASEFNKLYHSECINQDKGRISKVLKWLREHNNDKGVPKPSGVYQFCSPKIFNWCEDLMGRSEENDNSDSKSTEPKMTRKVVHNEDGSKSTFLQFEDE